MQNVKYVSYLRVSTKRQEQSGLGLEAQKESVNRHLNGIQPIAEYVEIESGRKTDSHRPELAKAFSTCRTFGATLIVARLDRLARNAHFLLGLKEAGVEFTCCDIPSANRLTIGIMAMVAEEEARLISIRTKSALAEVRGKGVQLGTDNLTESGRDKGIRIATINRVKKANVRADDIAPIIREMREVKGLVTFASMAEELNRLGVPTARGGKMWYPASVRNLIQRISG